MSCFKATPSQRFKTSRAVFCRKEGSAARCVYHLRGAWSPWPTGQGVILCVQLITVQNALTLAQPAGQ